MAWTRPTPRPAPSLRWKQQQQQWSRCRCGPDRPALRVCMRANDATEQQQWTAAAQQPAVEWRWAGGDGTPRVLVTRASAERAAAGRGGGSSRGKGKRPASEWTSSALDALLSAASARAPLPPTLPAAASTIWRVLVWSEGGAPFHDKRVQSCGFLVSGTAAADTRPPPPPLSRRRRANAGRGLRARGAQRQACAGAFRAPSASRGAVRRSAHPPPSLQLLSHFASGLPTGPTRPAAPPPRRRAC